MSRVNLGKRLKMRTRKKVYADKVKTPPSKEKEVSADVGDDGDEFEEDARVAGTQSETASTNGGGEAGAVIGGDSDAADDDEAPDDVGFSEAKSLALESMAVQKKTKLEEASRKKEKRRLQLERNIQQKEKKLKKSKKVEHEEEKSDELSLDFLEKLDEASKIARDAFI